MTHVIVTKRGVDRVRQGHLWIYRSDVVDIAGARGGSIVSLHDPHGNFVAQAFFSSASEIALRVLTQTREVIDREWWRGRLRQSALRRANVGSVTDAYRLVFAEGDLLPSLIVDVYGQVMVLQTLSQGTEALKPLLVELLVEEFQPGSIIERNDVNVRKLEGLALTSGSLYGPPPHELEITCNGVRFVVTPLSGQKTGSFLDQRENHLAARAVGHGRGLDCFTFNGGFALNLAMVCDHVTGIDISGEAIASAQRNAKLNGAGNVDFREANVFDTLREMESAGERFDTIVLDPPAFAKNRASVKSAMRGYKEINLRALKLLNMGGALITCSCSYHMSEEMFLSLIAEAASDARRRVHLIEKRMQASDHPVLLGVPETYYLKCMIVRAID
jgi:23S rRNA (cytosine1962-C5)-methyltransferase